MISDGAPSLNCVVSGYPGEKQAREQRGEAEHAAVRAVSDCLEVQQAREQQWEAEHAAVRAASDSPEVKQAREQRGEAEHAAVRTASDALMVVGCTPSGRRRCRVTFDNGVTCLLYRQEVRQLQLEEGELCTGEQYAYLMDELLTGRAKRYALHLLERMDRSERRLRELLERSEYPECCIDAAIDYVKGFRYLDDERYASSFVRCSQEKLSRCQLRQKLLARGIRSEVADRAIEEEYEADEGEQIRALLAKRRFDPEKADQKEFGRTYRFLLGRGFSNGDILRQMRAQ